MHLKEENRDLKIGPKIFNYFFALIFYPNFSFSQIPINGFINLTDITTIPNQKKIFSLNYNKDAYSDFLVYNFDDKYAYLLTGQPNLQFNKPQRIYFEFEPNFIKPIYNDFNQIVNYSIISRKSKIFALIDFNINGYPKILKTIKLNSFPNKVDAADVDLNNSIDYLISGEAFDGLSILYEKNNRLIEKKIFNNQCFSDAAFFDINSDEFIDIVAYNPLSEKLLFIFNKDGEHFRIERELKINYRVYKFQIFDMNLDGYKDLIFSTEIGLLIYYGDVLNIFDNFIVIRSESSINDFIVGDYNRDGYFDFICNSKSGNYLSIFYAKNNDKFFEEVIIDHNNSVQTIIPFFSKFIYGAAYLTIKGELKIISEFKSFKNDITFIYAINPTEIKTFDFDNNGILDLVFIDGYDNKIKFIIRDKLGIPTLFYSIKLKKNHSDLLIVQNSPDQFSYFCFTNKERLIEIINLDFNNFNYERKILYAEGKIQELITNTSSSKNELKILYSINDSLYFGTLKLSLDKKYNLIKYPIVSSNFIVANILNMSEDKIILWQKLDSLLNLNAVEYTLNMKKLKTIYSQFIGDDIKINNKIKVVNIIPRKSSDNNLFYALIATSEKIYLLLLNRDLNLLVKSEIQYFKSPTNTKFMAYDDDGFIYFYNNDSKVLYKAYFHKRTGKVITKKIDENINLEKFIISNIDRQNKILMYIDSKDQRIKTKGIID